MASAEDWEELGENEEEFADDVEEVLDIDEEEEIDAVINADLANEKKAVQDLLYRGFSGKLRADTHKLVQAHPEIQGEFREIVAGKLPLADVPIKDDPNHKTYPFLTHYEKTKILSLRASQLSRGAAAFIKVPSHVADVHTIARLELDAKRLPYIVKRPLPDGTCEYWRLQDLVVL